MHKASENHAKTLQPTWRPFRQVCRLTTATSLLICVLLPNLVILACAFFNSDDTHLLSTPLTLAAFHTLRDPMMLALIAQALWTGLQVTLICLCISYPCALALDQLPRQWQSTALTLLIIPFWTSTLVRTYAILNLLRAKGWLSNGLLQLGWIQQPLDVAFTPTATLVGLVYDLLPMMLVPLYLALRSMDHRLLEAARDLGAHAWSRFWRITWPQTAPAAVLGCLLVGLPAISLFYVPDILGGAKSFLLGNMIADAFAYGHWPLGAALCMSLLLPLMVLLPLRHTDRWITH